MPCFHVLHAPDDDALIISSSHSQATGIDGHSLSLSMQACMRAGTITTLLRVFDTAVNRDGQGSQRLHSFMTCSDIVCEMGVSDESRLTRDERWERAALVHDVLNAVQERPVVRKHQELLLAAAQQLAQATACTARDLRAATFAC